VIRNLILSGGIYHPFAETSAHVAAHLAELGIVSEICSVGEGLARLSSETFDLLTVNALAFSMTQAEKYAPLRAEHAFEIDGAGCRALEDHVGAGRGLLGLHTAPICFDTWPGWGRLLGASWVWGQSGHPMPDVLQVTWGQRTFQVWDELYGGLDLHPDAQVLATARLASGGPETPVLIARRNAAYLALGHDLRSVSSPDYAQMLGTAARMVLSPDQETV